MDIPPDQIEPTGSTYARIRYYFVNILVILHTSKKNKRNIQKLRGFISEDLYIYYNDIKNNIEHQVIAAPNIQFLKLRLVQVISRELQSTTISYEELETMFIEWGLLVGMLEESIPEVRILAHSNQALWERYYAVTESLSYILSGMNEKGLLDPVYADQYRHTYKVGDNYQKIYYMLPYRLTPKQLKYGINIFVQIISEII